MEICKLPFQLSSTVSSNNSLKQYLTNLQRGHDFTPRSWLYEHRSPERVLNDWMSILSRLEHGNSFEQKVFQFDTSQIEKWGPQGGVAPISELLDDYVKPSFLRADSPQPKAFASSEWQKAVQSQSSIWRKWNLRPASYSRVIDDMRARDTLESNSGWPDFARRNLPEVINSAIAAAEDGTWKSYPAIALFRNYNLKTRLVWMFPMAANLVEGSFFQVLQSAIVRSDTEFIAPWIGFERVRDIITRAYDSGLYVSASDFSGTDEHFLQFSSEQVYEAIAPAFQSAARPKLLESLVYMHNIPLVIGPDKMITGGHGVSSGSNWTNFVETIFDWILSRYVALLTNNDHQGLYAIGDDMAWVSHTFDDAFANKLQAWGEEVGQVIKAEKTTNDPDSVKTLQRLFQRGYRRPDGKLRAVYPTIRALKSSVYPEKYHNPKLWSSDMFCARQYMILENCVDHPLFEEFVKFVVRGQKDLIPFAKKTAKDLDTILRQTKLLPGLNPTYNQERRDSSLSQFKSIQIAKSL